MKNFNRFGYVYSLIRHKHPDWTHRRISYCTAYAIGYQRKNKHLYQKGIKDNE